MQDRIPCPNDPKHTILKSELDDHLSRCNARIPEDPWITANVNVGRKRAADDAEPDFYRPSDEEVAEMVEKIKKIYENVKDNVLDFKKRDFEASDIAKAAEAVNEKKKCHLIQLESILGEQNSNYDCF